APRLLRRDHLRRMRRGSVLVDVAIDQGGTSETSRPTSHADPLYVEEGVVHYCVPNMPAAVARTATAALAQAVLPDALELAARGLAGAVRENAGLREGLVEAMRQRHTYAATSNILLDFRLRDGEAEYIHGDAYASASVPEIYVNILGTDEIQEVALIRDNRYIHTRPGNGPGLEFTFRETTLEPGEHYYYVRVQQRDRNMAWSSPIWIRYR
ncbi:MAG: hypothetical protein K6U88_15785, partial [Dehalococcoidia bacterium]|nr:hypothetical protein [Dehalococcoidia bacterium]